MGMGYAPASCWTLTTDTINELARKEYDAFSKLLELFGVTLEEFARYRCYDAELGVLDMDAMMLDEAFGGLLVALKKKTKLDINIAYHDSISEGDRYDDVNGVYWEVDGVEQMTPAGKKLKNKLKFSRWVMYG